MNLSQLVQILQLNKDNFDTNIDYQVELVSIFTDIDPEIIYRWDKRSLDEELVKIKKILNAKSNSEEEITFMEQRFKKFPFNRLSMGEYIDLEYYLQQPDKIIEVIAILYRRFEQKDAFSEIEYEKYGSWLSIRSELFLDLEINDVVGIKMEFLEWRNNLQESYTGLFNQGYDDDEEEETKNTIDELARRQREQEAKSFTWENIILQLTNNDASKYRDALKMPIIMVFNMLSTFKNNA